MAKLFLLRHIKSQWNEENRFTGWIDVPLIDEHSLSISSSTNTKNEITEYKNQKAKELAAKVFQFKIDKIYTSSLFRNQDTIARMFEYVDQKYPIFIYLDKGKAKKWGHYIDISENDVPVFCTEKLNERYYGKLQGENKETIIKKYGKEKVRLWRRSYNVAPPGGESLKDVYKRTIPFYTKFVEKDLKQEKNVLIIASHHALRAIIKYIEKISDKEIINLEIPYAGLIEYEFDKKLNLKTKRIL